MQHYYRVKRNNGLVCTLHTYDDWDQVKAQFGDDLLAEVNGHGKILRLSYPSSIKKEMDRLLLSMNSDNIIEVNQKIVDLEEQLREACYDKAKQLTYRYYQIRDLKGLVYTISTKRSESDLKREYGDNLIGEVFNSDLKLYPWEHTLLSNVAFYNWRSNMEHYNPRVELHQNFYNSVIIPNLFPETKESPTMSESPMFQRIFPDLFKDPDTKAVESALSSKLQAAIDDLENKIPDESIEVPHLSMTYKAWLAAGNSGTYIDYLLAVVSKILRPLRIVVQPDATAANVTNPTTPVVQNPFTTTQVSRYFTTASYKELDEGIKRFIQQCGYTPSSKDISDEKLKQLTQIFKLNCNNFESAISVVLEPLLYVAGSVKTINLFTLDNVQDNHLHISVANDLGVNPLLSVKFEDGNFVMKLH